MSNLTLLTSRDIGVAENTLRALLTTKLLKGTNLDYHQWVAFNLIASQPSTSAARLTAQMQTGLRIDHDIAAEVLEQLQARDLIAINGDELSATRAGTELHAPIAKQTQANTQRMYAGLEDADLATAYRVLSTLTERADALLAAA